MTLSRQLLLSGFIVLLCLFTGMITFVVRNTQSFLNQQLSSHSQDTATALGLTLTTTMKNNDVVTASRAVDAVWDRGYYKDIIIEEASGKPIVERHMQVKVYEVPPWFIKMLPLKTEPKEALIMDGWNRVGKVRIESNPGFAYKQIWSTFIESSEWLVLTSIIAAIFGGMLLYIILRPLRAITAQAAAICNQQFRIQETLPWTIDLRQVVEAMNNMSKRLKNLFEEQALASEHLREQAYKDPVSKLGNRRYFDMQFDYLLKEEKGTTGILLLIELKDFKEYNDNYGYQAGDQLLLSTAKAIQECCVGYDSAVVSHVKGASFAVILPDTSKEVGIEAATKICLMFNEFYNLGLSKVQDVGHVGCVLFRPGDGKKEIMSAADLALRTAQTLAINSWKMNDQARPADVHGAQEWGAIFAKVISENSVILHFQRTQLWGTQKEQKTYETLMRLKINENEIVSAGIFMPMAERLNQIMALDKLVIENVVNKIMHSKESYHFSVNLSPSSIEDEEFKKWLLEKLKFLGKKANQLIIELPEYGVIHRIDKVRTFFLKFSNLGGKTSIDHYGKNFSSFSYLYNLKLNYLKIDGGFIKGINASEENQFFVRSLIDIAHSLGIFVIAEAVETQEEYATVQQLSIDGVQGYFVGKPMELEV